MMAIESAAERASFDEIEGTIARMGGIEFPCLFNDATAESLLMEGTAPELICSAARLEAVGVVMQSTIDEVRTFDGRVKGPYRVVRWQVQDEGAFVIVGLQQL